MKFTGTVQVTGFMAFEVEASTKAEAEKLVVANPDKYTTGDIESVVGNGVEIIREARDE